MNLQYPPILLDEIARSAGTGTGTSVPSPAAQARFLDIAFYAGLHRDEGRALSFTLAFLTPESIQTRGQGPFSALVLSTPVALSVENVVKLASAVDHRLASIGVAQDGDELRIWGFFRHGASEYELAEGLENFALSVGFDYLKVTCERPGRLDVDIGLYRVASFVDGRLETGPRVFLEQGLVYERLVKAGRDHGDNSYVESLQQIVWAIRAAQHGGTLLVLPDRELKHLRPRYLLDPSSRATSDVRDRLREYHATAREHSRLIQQLADAEASREEIRAQTGFLLRTTAMELSRTRTAVRESVRFVAGLANVDGALVLGPDLQVLAFGAVIERSEAEFKLKTMREAATESGEQVDVGILGGTRHQSAAHFCYQRVDAIGVVVSQDGGVSCFLNDGTALRVWRDVRLDRRARPVPQEPQPRT